MRLFVQQHELIEHREDQVVAVYRQTPRGLLGGIHHSGMGGIPVAEGRLVAADGEHHAFSHGGGFTKEGQRVGLSAVERRLLCFAAVATPVSEYGIGKRSRIKRLIHRIGLPAVIDVEHSVGRCVGGEAHRSQGRNEMSVAPFNAGYDALSDNRVMVGIAHKTVGIQLAEPAGASVVVEQHGSGTQSFAQVRFVADKEIELFAPLCSIVYMKSSIHIFAIFSAKVRKNFEFSKKNCIFAPDFGQKSALSATKSYL